MLNLIYLLISLPIEPRKQKLNWIIANVSDDYNRVDGLQLINEYQLVAATEKLNKHLSPGVCVCVCVVLIHEITHTHQVLLLS